MIPKQKEIEIPLLQVLVEFGGEGKPEQIYPRVTERFPSLSKEDLQKTLKKGQNFWINRIQWARQDLVTLEQIDNSKRGIWRITEKGRERLKNPEQLSLEPKTRVPKKKKVKETNEIIQTNLDQIYLNHEKVFKNKLLEKLLHLSPEGFESFAGRLLESYGFKEVKVTQKSKDGGIDGFGKLKVGLAYINVAFQCKRWQGKVGRPEIDKFRGACQGKYEQGLFFTTSDFSPDALDASFQAGAIPIILIHGEAIVDLMIEKGLGVEKIPLYRYEVKEEEFE